MKKFLIITLTSLILFSTGFLIYSDLDGKQNHHRTENHLKEKVYTEYRIYDGPWPPPDEM